MRRFDIIELFSYVALVVTALILLLRALGVNVAILDTIAYISALIGLGCAAFAFQRKQRHIAWKIIFWVALAVYIFAVVFPLIK